MVFWKKSIIAAFNVIGYSIMWRIVGLIIAIIGFSIMGNPMTFIKKEFSIADWILFFTDFILMALGYILIITGLLASFMKVFGEPIAEEIDLTLLKIKGGKYDY